MKILIVDDNEFILKLLERWVVRLWPAEVPHEVVGVCCLSADRAIDAVRRHEPDVLFLDYVLGEAHQPETGRDVALWIDQKYEKPICVATHTSHSDAREIFAGVRCVTHFVSISDPKAISEFIEVCTNRKEKSDGQQKLSGAP